MKKFYLLTATLLVAVLITSCAVPWRTYMLNEDFPQALDESTLLPIIDEVIVTRTYDGASVTVRDVEIERFLMCFENILCTKKKAQTLTGAYTIEFVMTDPANVQPQLIIAGVHDSIASVFVWGEYRYETINMIADVSYIESLFS